MSAIGLAILLGAVASVASQATARGPGLVWSTPLEVSELGVRPDLARVGISADGSGLVVWDHDGFEARAISASGRLGPIRTVWPGSMGPTGNGFGFFHSASGNAVMTFRSGHLNGTFMRVWSSSGRLGPLQRLPDFGDPESTVIDGAVDRTGRATIVIEANGQLEAQPVDPTGHLLTPIALPVTGLFTLNAQSGLVGIDRRGDVVISWVQGPDSNHLRIWARTLFADGIVGPAVAISAQGSVPAVPDGEQMAVAADGAATFVCQMTAEHHAGCSER